MKRFFTALLILSLTVTFGYAKGHQQIKAITNQAVDAENYTPINPGNGVIPHLAKTTQNNGPGEFLLDNAYDYNNNGNMPKNIYNYGDGTLAIARMAATTENITDRGSWFSYFDGSSWSQMTKVEGVSRGWSSISATADGRSVITAHTGNECNVDALKGFGIWTSYITRYLTGVTDHIWPRLTVDGKDNFHVMTTARAAITGARFGTYYPVHSWSTDQGVSWNHQWIFGDPFTELDTTNGQWRGFNIDDYPIDAFGPNKVATISVPRMRSGLADLWLAESEDNGATWKTKNLTKFPPIPEPGTELFTPSQGVDLIYDNNGAVHIIAANYRSVADSAGTAVDVFHSTAAPMRHWSEATGWVDILTFQDIPGYNPNEAIFAGVSTNNTGGGNNTLINNPSMGIDKDGNIYVIFSVPVPGDTIADGSHFHDVFAVGSGDGGATWGPPVNVTNAPGLEDLDASLAKLVDENLHIVYHSDPQIGNNSASGAPPYRTNMMYYAFPKSNISLVPVNVSSKNSVIPDQFALHQNYPNPFNPTTTITFDLKTSSNVNLSIFDVAGKLVTTLVNGKMTAGQYSVSWNADNMTSGVYFAKLQSDGFSAVKKMMLIK